MENTQLECVCFLIVIVNYFDLLMQRSFMVLFSKIPGFFSDSVTLLIFSVEFFLILGSYIPSISRLSIFHNNLDVHLVLIFIGVSRLVVQVVYELDYYAIHTPIPYATPPAEYTEPTRLSQAHSDIIVGKVAFYHTSMHYNTHGFVVDFFYWCVLVLVSQCSQHPLFLSMFSFLFFTFPLFNPTGLQPISEYESMDITQIPRRIHDFTPPLYIFFILASTLFHNFFFHHSFSPFFFRIVVWCFPFIVYTIPQILKYRLYIPDDLPPGAPLSLKGVTGDLELDNLYMDGDGDSGDGDCANASGRISASGASTSSTSSAQPEPARDKTPLTSAQLCDLKSRQLFPLLMFLYNYSRPIVRLLIIILSLYDLIYDPMFLLYDLILFSISELKIHVSRRGRLWGGRRNLFYNGISETFYFLYFLVWYVLLSIDQQTTFYRKTDFLDSNINVKRHIVLLSFATLPWVLPSLSLLAFLQIVVVALFFAFHISSLEITNIYSIISIEMVGLSLLSFFGHFVRTMYSQEATAIISFAKAENLGDVFIVPRWDESMSLCLILFLILLFFVPVHFSPSFYHGSRKFYNFIALPHSALFLLTLVSAIPSYNNVYLDITFEVIVTVFILYFAKSVKDLRNATRQYIRSSSVNMTPGHNGALTPAQEEARDCVDHWNSRASLWVYIIFPFSVALYVVCHLRDFWFLQYSSVLLLQYCASITIQKRPSVATRSQRLVTFVGQSIVLVILAISLQSYELLGILLMRVVFITMYVLRKYLHRKSFIFVAVGSAICIILFAGWWQSSGYQRSHALYLSINTKLVVFWGNVSKHLFTLWDQYGSIFNDKLNVMFLISKQGLMTVFSGRNQSIETYIDTFSLQDLNLFPSILWVYISILAVLFRNQQIIKEIEARDDSKDK